MTEKRYVVKKYVMARSAAEALRKEKLVKADDVWKDDKQPELEQHLDLIGFRVD